MHRTFGWLRIVAACLLGICATGRVGAAYGQEPRWQAGVARAVITPEKAVWLAGYGTKRVPDGKLHELWMKALALEDPSGNRAVLVTSDFQGIPKGMSDRVFARLQKELKLQRHQVMLTFSHNHCGPRLGDDLVDYYPVEAEQVKLVDEYTALMETRTVELIRAALAKLAPATLQTGEGRTTFAVNRRNNREADVPALLARGEPLKGPVDHAVPVLTVTGRDRKPVAIVFGYACHPTTLSFTKWCGDYPGFAQLALEKNHPGALAMFVNTCGGDQNPLPRRKVELCEKYGRMLADAVEEALKKPMQSVAPGLRTAFAYVDLPYEKVITRAELQAFTKDQNAIRKRWAERLLRKLDAGEQFAPSYPYPLHAWRLGKEMLVIGTGAETVVDYALRFKAKYGAGPWVCGYADDMIAYIPSRRVWAEGGYEGGPNLFEYGRPALRWAGDIEERIADAVHSLVKAVGGGPSSKQLPGPPARTEQPRSVNPFYAMDTCTKRPYPKNDIPPAAQLELLRELGYAGIAWTEEPPAQVRAVAAEAKKRGLKIFAIYCGAQVTPDGDLKHSPRLPEILAALEGHETIVWLHIGGKGPAFEALTEKAPVVKKCRALADTAATHGLRVAVYPHVGEWTARFADATQLARVVNHPRFGVTFNLCHSLALGDEKRIPELLKGASKLLFTVTINGADTGLARPDWGRLIQTLDKGSYDVGIVLRTLRRLGYGGPVGLQGYGIGGDRRANLAASMAAWKRLARAVGGGSGF
jgi:sugar phosphate isomerase/epimerase